jgi:hypothetical protein
MAMIPDALVTIYVCGNGYNCESVFMKNGDGQT